ncbi:MAG: O-antigen ligase family protein [Anaerolineae bacterium]|nr:O-antigen ligase family protein [Anaerolineae bacterium]
MINNQRRISLNKSRTFLPLLLMLASASLSFIVGQLSWFLVPGASLSAQIGGLSIFFICAFAFLLAAHYFRTIRWLEWATWSFIIVGALFVVPALSPALLRQVSRFVQVGSYSSQFWTWFILLTFSQAWLNHKLPKWARATLLGLCASALYIVLVKEFDWKSGWIPPLVGLAAMLALYSWKFLALMGIGGFFALPVVIARLIAGDEYSYGTRVDAWIILGEIIKVNPILGLGPANYYWFTPLYAIRGYSVEFNSHNQYIDLLAQVGIIGTFMVLWFFCRGSPSRMEAAQGCTRGLSQSFCLWCHGWADGNGCRRYVRRLVLTVCLQRGHGGYAFQHSALGLLRGTGSDGAIVPT